MVTSAGVGFILERMGLHAMFGIYALIVAGLAVAAVLLPQQPVQISAFSLSGLSVMLRRPPWLVFTISLFLLGIGFAGVSNFVSVTISTMGGSDSLIGLAWMFSAVSELPVMFFSVALLRRFGSARILALAMLLYVGRFLLYGAMTSPVWALFINLGFGCAFGMYWLAAVTYINELAPDNLKTTSQSLFMSVMNLSNVLGAVVTGWLFDRVGPSGMFFTLAGLSSCALLLFVVGRTVLGRRQTRSADSVVVKEMLHD